MVAHAGAAGALAAPARRGRATTRHAAPLAVLGGRRSPSRSSPRPLSAPPPLSFGSLIGRSGKAAEPTESAASVPAAQAEAGAQAPPPEREGRDSQRSRRLGRLVQRVRRAASPRALRRRVLAWRSADQTMEGPVQPAAVAAALEALPAALPEKAEERPVKPTPDIRRFLRPTSNAELATARKMASLSAFAYFISSVTERSLAKSHRLKLVTTSLVRRLSEARPQLDRARLAEAILAAPAAPPYTRPPLVVPAPERMPRGVLPAAVTALPVVAQAVPAAAAGLLRYLPSDAVDLVLAAARRDAARDGDAARDASGEAEAAAERALSDAVANVLALATAEASEARAAEAAAAASPARALLWPLRQRPVLSAAVRVSRVARDVVRPAAAVATPLVSSASTYVSTLAAAAAPLAVAAASGSSAAAAALAAAAGPLAATAAAGSSVAAQALGGIIEPLASTASAGGSLAGSTLASITGAMAAAAASAATRVRGRPSGPATEAEAAAEASAALVTSSTSAAAAAAAARAGRAFCPCEWFVGDDERSATRYFVVQGSDSVASWRSNLAFDPVTFEDPALGAKVHRGVYEAACALYEALTPLVNEHVARHGRKARLSFTGHSLGGSLATLMMLMLRYRRPELADALEPVYTVGAPSIFCDDCCGDCGADKRVSARAQQRARAAAGVEQRADCCRGVLGALGLPRDHVRNVMMHLDIVPRAFACDYRLVQGMLRRIGGSFREHPGLQGPDNVTMYSPAGVTLVLQPSEAAAQQHAMLPPGSGLYVIDDPSDSFWSAVGVPWALGGNGGGSGSDDAADAEAEAGAAAVADARAALSALLNSPHPLDILADVAAYGPQGTVSQFHNPWGYARALAAEQRRRQQWRAAATGGAKTTLRVAAEATSRLASAAGSVGARLGLPSKLTLPRLPLPRLPLPRLPLLREGAAEEDDTPDDFEQFSV